MPARCAASGTGSADASSGVGLSGATGPSVVGASGVVASEVTPSRGGVGSPASPAPFGVSAGGDSGASVRSLEAGVSDKAIHLSTPAPRTKRGTVECAIA